MKYGLIDPVDISNTGPSYPYITEWVVRGFGIILYPDGRPLFGTCLNGYQSNPSTNPFAASGQYLAALESLLSFPGRKWEMPTEISAVDLWQCALGETVKTFRNAAPILSTDQVLELISRASKNTARTVLEYSARLIVRAAFRIRKLFERRFIREVYTTRHRVHHSIPRFCGLSWARRLWYLIHGSHPPKTECCPAFGCA